MAEKSFFVWPITFPSFSNKPTPFEYEDKRFFPKVCWPILVLFLHVGRRLTEFMWIFVDFWITVGLKRKEGKICASCRDDDSTDGVSSIIGIVSLELICTDERSEILGKTLWEEPLA